MRVLALMLAGAIAVVGLFPGLVRPTSYAPLPCCSEAGGFQVTFAMTGSETVYLASGTTDQENRQIAELEIKLDELRERLHIPGFSAAVVKNQEVLWARGFGCADISSGRPATPHTPYSLASLTKPFGATILLQLVEDGLVGLDDPIEDYGVTVNSRGTVLVEHLLSHTSHGVPGRSYRYDGSRFGLIDQIMQSATGKAFGDLLVERILQPLEMSGTMPMPLHDAEAAYDQGLGDPTYQDVWDRLAKPYFLVRGYGNVLGQYVNYFGSAAGLVSSVMDYAKFDAAIDSHQLISEETQALAWTPYTSISGRALPYGFGWFVQYEGNLQHIWHYGYWDCTSTLIVKVPERRLTFLLFANSDRLSSPFGLGAGDVRRSPAARAFLEVFVE